MGADVIQAKGATAFLFAQNFYDSLFDICPSDLQALSPSHPQSYPHKLWS